MKKKTNKKHSGTPLPRTADRSDLLYLFLMILQKAEETEYYINTKIERITKDGDDFFAITDQPDDKLVFFLTFVRQLYMKKEPASLATIRDILTVFAGEHNQSDILSLLSAARTKYDNVHIGFKVRIEDEIITQDKTDLFELWFNSRFFHFNIRDLVQRYRTPYSARIAGKLMMRIFADFFIQYCALHRPIVLQALRMNLLPTGMYSFDDISNWPEDLNSIRLSIPDSPWEENRQEHPSILEWSDKPGMFILRVNK